VKKWLILWEIPGNFGANFTKKLSAKNGQFCWKAIGFALLCRTFLAKNLTAILPFFFPKTIEC